jgi:hypothetical protein
MELLFDRPRTNRKNDASGIPPDRKLVRGLKFKDNALARNTIIWQRTLKYGDSNGNGQPIRGKKFV